VTLSDPLITHVEIRVLGTEYPRTVGRNARLGVHGTGGPTTIAVITTETGVIGWGLVEGPVGGTADVVGRSLSELLDPLTGVMDPAHLWLDVALHDLAGVVGDLPVYALLGAAGSRTVEVYDGAIYFDDLDPLERPRGVGVLLDECAADAARGYHNFKLKIGRGNRWMERADGDRRDIEITRMIRQAWPEAKILVDANDGYRCDGFLRYLEAVADCDLYWVEEPFLDDADDLAALRACRDAISPQTLIAEGETTPDVEALLPITAAGDVDVLLMDAISYGITRWRRTMPLLPDAAMASPHAWGHPLKTLYAAQLAAGLGRIPIVEGVPGRTVGIDTSAYPFVDGHLTVSDRPGFGLRLPE
jgi:D-galactarolactone cycloisomerase